MKRNFLQFLLLFTAAVFTASFLPVAGCSKEMPPELSLAEPEISGLHVIIDGKTVPGTADTKIIKTYWYWGDGTFEDREFPASHTYYDAGTYNIKVISIQSDGQSTTALTSVSVSAIPKPPPTTPSSIMNVAGTWSGPAATSLNGSAMATVTLDQVGTSFTGVYQIATTRGNISGTVIGNTLNFKITITSPADCGGSFSGTGTVTDLGTQRMMIFEYSGSSTCGGQEKVFGVLKQP